MQHHIPIHSGAFIARRVRLDAVGDFVEKTQKDAPEKLVAQLSPDASEKPQKAAPIEPQKAAKSGGGLLAELMAGRL